jgi:hypothetical protein
VSTYSLYFDGSQQTFAVYYNPAPEANNLSARISEPCGQPAPDALAGGS